MHTMTDEEISQWCRARRTHPQRLLARERVLAVPCPQCDALEDENCLKRNGVDGRKSNHLPRVFEALRALYHFD